MISLKTEAHDFAIIVGLFCEILVLSNFLEEKKILAFYKIRANWKYYFI